MRVARFSGRKFNFFSICLLAGFFTSFSVLVDSIAVTFIPDPVLFGFFIIIGGMVITIIIWGVLSLVPISNHRRLGNLLDKDFKVSNMRLPLLSMKYILIASIFNAASLILYLFGVLQFDPSLMLPLMQFVVIYLMLTEFISSRDLPTIVEFQSITMITLGAIIVTINPEMELNLLAVILVLFPLNFLTGLSTFFQKRAINVKFPDGHKVDAISTRVWMVFGLFLFYGIPSLLLLGLQNRLVEFFLAFSTHFSLGMAFAIVSMLITFFAQAFRLRGLSIGKTYIVNALVSISVVFSIPLTLFALIFVDPLIFGGDVSLDFFLWVLKSIGSILIFIGIISMVLSEVRGYILIKVKMGFLVTDIMTEIQKIHGVQSVSALFGEYDLIIYYRIRSVGKILKLIIREIAIIPGVETVSTQVVLREINKY